MKKTLHTLTAATLALFFLASHSATAQHGLPFSDSFQSYVNTDDFVQNSGWTTIDHNGDGYNWYLHISGNLRAMASESWDGQPLQPENYLITPQLQLPDHDGAPGDPSIFLSFDVAATGNNFYEEHYKVVVSTTGNSPADFVDDNIVWEETLDQSTSGSNFDYRIINLNDFAGETVYIAFVHYDVTDMDRLLINNVGVNYTTSAIIHPDVVHFNAMDPADVSTRLLWLMSSEVTAIHHNGDALNPGTDYEVTDLDGENASLTIMAHVFEGATSDVELTLSFDAGGTEMVLTVKVLAAPQDASVDPILGRFDPGDPADVTTLIHWGSATAITAIHDGSSTLDPNHYQVEGNQLSILAAYFDGQEPGYVAFAISFDAGEDAHFYVQIFDHSAHALPFEENFMGMEVLGGNTPETWLPNGWISVDANGDGHNWYWVPVTADGVVSFGRMQSRSAVQDDEGEWQALFPDNWLFTPPIELDPITAEGQSIELRFRVAPGAATPGFRLEHYSVMISFTDMDPGSFSEIFSETLSQDHPQNELQERTVELSFYEGQTVYLAFRHHEVSDMDRLLMSQVEVEKLGETSIPEVNETTIRVFPNPAASYLNIHASARIHEVSVYNVSGQLVMLHAAYGEHHQLNLGRLPEGTYIVRAVTDQGVHVERVQVMHGK